jgi:DNA helicase HerA-like ATPase
LVISGQPGSGKSQLALDLLAQLTRSGVRFVFFDMNGELVDDPNSAEQRRTRTQFLKQTGARYVLVDSGGFAHQPALPPSEPDRGRPVAYEIANLFRVVAASR